MWLIWVVYQSCIYVFLDSFQDDTLSTKHVECVLQDKGKSKVFYGQEPPSGEYTTTE